jgi:hypothetical protein
MFIILTAAVLAAQAFQVSQLQAQQEAWAQSPEGQAELAAQAAFENAQRQALEAQLQAEQACWAAFERLTFPY